MQSTCSTFTLTEFLAALPTAKFTDPRDDGGTVCEHWPSTTDHPLGGLAIDLGDLHDRITPGQAVLVPDPDGGTDDDGRPLLVVRRADAGFDPRVHPEAARPLPVLALRLDAHTGPGLGIFGL